MCKKETQECCTNMIPVHERVKVPDEALLLLVEEKHYLW